MKKLTKLASLLMVSAGLMAAPLAAQAAPAGANVTHQAEKPKYKKQSVKKQAPKAKAPKKAKPNKNVKKAKKKTAREAAQTGSAPR
ncbi:late embryogeneis abundant protein [Neisseria dentiae]|uniref:late embryogeneis abundant protein n=1 Tax=Neisseria dentiae TaxID=194197 RepID=UPI00211BFFCC|nr:late embryogeneis abundant protein [Neisseria dentiae]MCQ9326175.1 late embryogeneis abundant protein [Neisseria dentiae]